MADLDALQAKAEAAQAAFRAALADWRRAANGPPRFLLGVPAPRMRPDAFAGARVFAHRDEMIATLAKPGGTGAEVGVQRGHFSRVLIDRLAPARLHLFDMHDALLDADIRDHSSTILHLGDSSSKLMALPDAHFDWIYIDGDHRYDGVLKDARAALQKVKPGGLIFFNDYTPWSPGEVMPYGVMAVVNMLVNEGADMVGVALSPSGYFDVVLRP